MKLNLQIITALLCVASAFAAYAQDVPSANGFPAPSTQSEAPKIIRISSGVAQGIRIKSVAPIYPPDARAAHVQGQVILKMNITKDGIPGEIEVVSGPEMLQQAAIVSVMQWRYRPYLLNGNAVAVQTQVIINFNLAN